MLRITLLAAAALVASACAAPTAPRHFVPTQAHDTFCTDDPTGYIIVADPYGQCPYGYLVTAG